ncbi:MAG: hypothetical protein FD129_3154, partial [bacterium]
MTVTKVRTRMILIFMDRPFSWQRRDDTPGRTILQLCAADSPTSDWTWRPACCLPHPPLSRDIEITDLRVGRNGAPPVSISDFALLSATSETRVAVTLPPLLPGGAERRREVTAVTNIEGTVA